jgi:hypothetical protein
VSPPAGAPFDPVAWARDRVGPPGPGAAPAHEPPAAIEAELEVDAESLLATVDPAARAVAVEARLREAGLTLGLFPESYETASIGELVRRDEPGAGASGPGFASRHLGTDAGGRLVLGVRRRPAAQAGRGLVLPSLARGIRVLRTLAQSDDLPDLALLADSAAARLWLAVAGDPDGASAAIGDDDALLLLIAAGEPGEAARRVAAAVSRAGAAEPLDLGQTAARAWAGARYDLARHAATLREAGYELGVARELVRWSAVPDACERALSGAGEGRLVSRELAGATPHGAELVVRTLTASSA